MIGRYKFYSDLDVNLKSGSWSFMGRTHGPRFSQFDPFIVGPMPILHSSQKDLKLIGRKSQNTNKSRKMKRTKQHLTVDS